MRAGLLATGDMNPVPWGGQEGPKDGWPSKVQAPGELQNQTWIKKATCPEKQSARVSVTLENSVSHAKLSFVEII